MDWLNYEWWPTIASHLKGTSLFLYFSDSNITYGQLLTFTDNDICYLFGSFQDRYAVRCLTLGNAANSNIQAGTSAVHSSSSVTDASTSYRATESPNKDGIQAIHTRKTEQGAEWNASKETWKNKGVCGAKIYPQTDTWCSEIYPYLV